MQNLEKSSQKTLFEENTLVAQTEFDFSPDIKVNKVVNRVGRPKKMKKSVKKSLNILNSFKISFVITTMCNFQSCIIYQYLQNSANLVEIRFQCEIKRGAFG
ncbi:hypothetical protein BpHYR1_043824 [Brachionus plicatilis]|uniref:Uncharacterized protein n=1 Tax=Brachionus plicatilis TaxID=10195 RepID=A0A3M7RWV9_BRAPC|nr:hypothetical protein BpHYR1_043824 [Brachionus plicatilis]